MGVVVVIVVISTARIYGSPSLADSTAPACMRVYVRVQPPHISRGDDIVVSGDTRVGICFLGKPTVVCTVFYGRHIHIEMMSVIMSHRCARASFGAVTERSPVMAVSRCSKSR